MITFSVVVHVLFCVLLATDLHHVAGLQMHNAFMRLLEDDMNSAADQGNSQVSALECGLLRCRGKDLKSIEDCMLEVCDSEPSAMTLCLVYECGQNPGESCIDECTGGEMEQHQKRSVETKHMPFFRLAMRQHHPTPFNLNKRGDLDMESTENRDEDERGLFDCSMICDVRRGGLFTARGRQCFRRVCGERRGKTTAKSCWRSYCAALITESNRIATSGAAVGAEVKRSESGVAPNQHSEQGEGIALGKRWAERVCMETHCGHVTSNSPQYFMCGSQFCHGG